MWELVIFFMDIWFLIGLAMALVVGAGVGYVIRKSVATKSIDSAEANAQRILTKAKDQEKEILLNAKDRALTTIEEAKVEEEKRRAEMTALQERVQKRESTFDQKLISLETRQEELEEKKKEINAQKEELRGMHQQQMEKLERIAELSKNEAKDLLLSHVENNSQEDLKKRLKKMDDISWEELENKAKDMLSVVIQRVASSHVAESTSTMVALPTEDMKGRIIGKEGRNIKTLEALTGVEVIVDDTPDSIVISGFSPIRRTLAKIALEKLMSDGRIHPARIEETIEHAKQELARDIRKAGEEACTECGVTGFDPKLVAILGRLKYRTSYGQNVLRHSVEISHISGLLANMLGANVPLAKKAGLFHDIGKAVDHEVMGTHPDIGRDIAKKFGLSNEFADAAFTHHDDSPPTIEGVIVKVADAISGGRYGARKDTFEKYIQRLEELEGLATKHDGVDKAYAIQAGREIRVFVNPNNIDDWAAQKLARQIADDIESEMSYPGEIKITLIRERRVIEHAR